MHLLKFVLQRHFFVLVILAVLLSGAGSSWALVDRSKSPTLWVPTGIIAPNQIKAEANAEQADPAQQPGEKGMAQNPPVKPLQDKPIAEDLVPTGEKAPAETESENPETKENVPDEQCKQAMAGYQANLRKMTDNGWNPPKPPEKGEWSSVISYRLNHSHQIENVQLMRSSGFKALDDSAAERVKAIADQFEPLPKCYQQSSLEIEHTFTVKYE